MACVIFFDFCCWLLELESGIDKSLRQGQMCFQTEVVGGGQLAHCKSKRWSAKIWKKFGWLLTPN